MIYRAVQILFPSDYSDRGINFGLKLYGVMCILREVSLKAGWIVNNCETN